MDYIGNQISQCKEESKTAINLYIFRDLNYENQDVDQFKFIFEQDQESPIVRILFAHMHILQEIENYRTIVNDLLMNVNQPNRREQL